MPISILKAINNTDRLKILAYISKHRPKTIRLMKSSLNLTDGDMSRHLFILREHKLILTSEFYKNRNFRVNEEILEFQDGELKTIKL